MHLTAALGLLAEAGCLTRSPQIVNLINSNHPVVASAALTLG